MYSFYETIKKEVDLHDLVEYLNEPLEKLKLLQIKLQEYKEQHNSKNKIEIEELIRETDKLEKNLFPDLINNYCKLSLEFRNNHFIKESKDKHGNTVNYTSKDLLLKNMAKLIEHIELLDEKFYTYFSFDFLVNSRIISDLGYQENFIDSNEKSPIVLKNQYVFSKEDARKIIDQQLSGTKIKSNPIYTKKMNEEIKAFGPKLQLKKEDDDDELEEIFNKKQQNQELEVAAKKHNEQFETDDDDGAIPIYGISFIEIQLVVGFIIMEMLGVVIIYNKVKLNQEKQIALEQQKEKMIKIQEQNSDMANNSVISSNKIIEQLNANKEKNNIIYQEGIDNAYKEVVKLMNNSVELNKRKGDETNNVNYVNLFKNGYNMSTNNKLIDNQNMLADNQTYTLNVKNDKIKVEVSNVFKNQCQYLGIKLAGEYIIKVNNKQLTNDNAKEVCNLTNTIAITEK